MKKIQTAIFFLLLSAPFQTFAAVYKGLSGQQGAEGALSIVGDKAGNKTDLPTMIGNLINVLLGSLGIVFVLLIVFAGIQYMTAAGDDTKVKKAKTMLTQAVIGMIIVVAAYSISAFVIGQLSAVSSGGGTPAAPPSPQSVKVGV